MNMKSGWPPMLAWMISYPVLLTLSLPLHHSRPQSLRRVALGTRMSQHPPHHADNNLKSRSEEYALGRRKSVLGKYRYGHLCSTAMVSRPIDGETFHSSILTLPNWVLIYFICRDEISDSGRQFSTLFCLCMVCVLNQKVEIRWFLLPRTAES